MRMGLANLGTYSDVNYLMRRVSGDRPLYNSPVVVDVGVLFILLLMLFCSRCVVAVAVFAAAAAAVAVAVAAGLCATSKK